MYFVADTTTLANFSLEYLIQHRVTNTGQISMLVNIEPLPHTANLIYRFQLIPRKSFNDFDRNPRVSIFMKYNVKIDQPDSDPSGKSYSQTFELFSKMFLTIHLNCLPLCAKE